MNVLQQTILFVTPDELGEGLFHKLKSDYRHKIDSVSLTELLSKDWARLNEYKTVVFLFALEHTQITLISKLLSQATLTFYNK